MYWWLLLLTGVGLKSLYKDLEFGERQRGSPAKVTTSDITS